MMDHQTVIRVDKSAGNYFVLHRKACNDKRLSIEALGLHTWMMSRPDNWEFSVAGMVASRKDGDTHIRTALAELKEHGYVRHYRERDDKGRLGKAVILVLETPDVEVPNLETPNLENGNQGKSLHVPSKSPNRDSPKQDSPKQVAPHQESPNVGNQAQISTRSLASNDLCVVEEEEHAGPTFDFKPEDKIDKLHDEIAMRIGKSFLDSLDIQCLTKLILDGVPQDVILAGFDLVCNSYKPKRNGDKVRNFRYADEQIREYNQARIEIMRGKQEIAAGGNGHGEGHDSNATAASGASGSGSNHRVAGNGDDKNPGLFQDL